MILFPERLDKDIAENDPVRVVDSVIDNLKLDNFFIVFIAFLPPEIHIFRKKLGKDAALNIFKSQTLKNREYVSNCLIRHTLFFYKLFN